MLDSLDGSLIGADKAVLRAVNLNSMSKPRAPLLVMWQELN